MQSNCKACGVVLPEGAIICPACGKPADEAAFATAPTADIAAANTPVSPAPAARPVPPAYRAAYRAASAPAYGAPPYGQPGMPAPAPPPVAKRISVWAVLSFIVGLLGLFFCGIFLGGLAAVLGLVALIAFRPATQKGRGFAVAGLLIGIFDIVGLLLLF